MEFTESTINNQTFRYADIGTGLPVVLLHGFPDGPESWAETASAIVLAGHRAIVPYLRGYHPSTITPGRPYRRAEVGADVIGLLDVIGIDAAVLVGHDWGAAAVWNAVSVSPERVLGVVPIAIPHPAALKPSPKMMWQTRHFMNLKGPLSNQRTARSNFKYLETLYDRWAPNWSSSERDQALERARAIMSDPAVLNETLQWYRDLKFSPDPANNFRVTCPGLLVAGSEDFDGVLEAISKSQKRFDAPVELLTIDGAGHWPHREGSEEFTASLLTFLGKL